MLFLPLDLWLNGWAKLHFWSFNVMSSFPKRENCVTRTPENKTKNARRCLVAAPRGQHREDARGTDHGTIFLALDCSKLPIFEPKRLQPCQTVSPTAVQLKA